MYEFSVYKCNFYCDMNVLHNSLGYRPNNQLMLVHNTILHCVSYVFGLLWQFIQSQICSIHSFSIAVTGIVQFPSIASWKYVHVEHTCVLELCLPLFMSIYIGIVKRALPHIIHMDKFIWKSTGKTIVSLFSLSYIIHCLLCIRPTYCSLCCIWSLVNM